MANARKRSRPSAAAQGEAAPDAAPSRAVPRPPAQGKPPAGKTPDGPEAALRRLDRRVRAAVPKAQLAAFKRAIARLDRAFVEEKCQLAIDTALEIRRIGSAKRSALLQRNLWATLDALAVHLDATEFTRDFRPVAAAVLRALPLDHPDVLDGEFALIEGVLGRRARAARELGFDRRSFAALAALAESHRSGRHGAGQLADRRFGFKRAAGAACHRPLGVLASHRVGGVVFSKVPIAVIAGAANIITLFAGWWPVTVITVGVLLIIWSAGC